MYGKIFVARAGGLCSIIIVNNKPTNLATNLCLTHTHCHILVLRGSSFNNRVAVAGRIIGCPNINHAANHTLARAVHRRTRSFNTRFLSTRTANLSISNSVGAIRASHNSLGAFNVLVTANTDPHGLNFRNRTRCTNHNITCYTAYSNRFFANGRMLIINNKFTTTRRSIFLAGCTSGIAILIHRPSFAYSTTITTRTGGGPGVSIHCRIRLGNIATNRKILQRTSVLGLTANRARA